MNRIEGHGRPTKYKAAEKGTIYTDLDTGKEYECKGTYGFIDVDLVDEPIEYKWILIDKIDSNRLPSGGGAFVVNIRENLYTGEVTTDISSEDIIKQIDAGKTIVFNAWGFTDETCPDGVMNIFECQWVGAGYNAESGEVFSSHIGSNGASGGSRVNQVWLSIKGTTVTLENSPDVQLQNLYVDTANALFVRGGDNKMYRISVNAGVISAKEIQES